MCQQKDIQLILYEQNSEDPFVKENYQDLSFFFQKIFVYFCLYKNININLQMLTLASYCKEVMEKGLIVQVAMLVLVLVGVESTIVAEEKQQTVYYVAKQQFHQNHCRAILILQRSGVKI